MRVSKRPRTAAANGKLASGKQLSAVLTKLIQDELSPGAPEARHLKASSNQDNDNVRLPPVRENKRPRTEAANGKPVSGKLLSVSTKLALEIGEDVRAKKVFTLNTS